MWYLQLRVMANIITHNCPDIEWNENCSQVITYSLIPVDPGHEHSRKWCVLILQHWHKRWAHLLFPQLQWCWKLSGKSQEPIQLLQMQPAVQGTDQSNTDIVSYLVWGWVLVCTLHTGCQSNWCLCCCSTGLKWLPVLLWYPIHVVGGWMVHGLVINITFSIMVG